MIPPFNIDVRECHQFVHDLVGSRTSVEYVADYVQSVYRQRTYERAERGYKILGDAGVDEAVRIFFLELADLAACADVGAGDDDALVALGDLRQLLDVHFTRGERLDEV